MSINIDISTEEGQVRLLIGDVVEPYVVADAMITQVLAKFPDESSALRVWNSAIVLADMICMQFGLEGGGSRKREKTAMVETEVYGYQAGTGYCELAKMLRMNPPSNVEGGAAVIKIGGVTKLPSGTVKVERGWLEGCMTSLYGTTWYDWFYSEGE